MIERLELIIEYGELSGTLQEINEEINWFQDKLEGVSFSKTSIRIIQSRRDLLDYKFEDTVKKIKRIQTKIKMKGGEK